MQGTIYRRPRCRHFVLLLRCWSWDAAPGPRGRREAPDWTIKPPASCQAATQSSPASLPSSPPSPFGTTELSNCAHVQCSDIAESRNPIPKLVAQHQPRHHQPQNPPPKHNLRRDIQAIRSASDCGNDDRTTFTPATSKETTLTPAMTMEPLSHRQQMVFNTPLSH